MHRTLLVLLMATFISSSLIAQKWVDSQYNIVIRTDSIYGYAVDYTGKSHALLCDIAIPLDDTIPECGRPLAVIVHGGSFLAGSKEDYDIQLWMKEFAKKGYVSVAINYRLGMFQTPDYITCGMANWGCLNMADSAEWYRGNYRGMQDCKGAIRYMISKKEEYHIDPANVFLIGESAGAFITLAAAYMDDESERSAWTGNIGDVDSPASEYQNDCIPPNANPIGQMDLSRADLGPINGDILPEYDDYQIKGVASFFGGMMTDILEKKDLSTELPALYIYAQPNDLIVPFGRDKVMAGLSACAVQYSGCNYLLNVPDVFGNFGIDLISAKEAAGKPVPEYKAEFTENYADCVLQALFPGLTGHAVDDIYVRTKSMATFFAKHIEQSGDCISENNKLDGQNIVIYPNPAHNDVNIGVRNYSGKFEVRIYNTDGNELLRKTIDAGGGDTKLDFSGLGQGLYIAKVKMEDRIAGIKLIIY